MSVSYKHIFKLNNNFTKEELKKYYLLKINEDNNKIKMNNIDKQFWLQQLNNLYLQGKQDISKRQLNNNFNQQLSNQNPNNFNQQLTNQNPNNFNQQLRNSFPNNLNTLFTNNLNTLFTNNLNTSFNNNLNTNNLNTLFTNNLNTSFNNNLPIGNSVGYSKSFTSVTGNDGITYVKEINKTINNDKVKSNHLSYKIDKDGNKTFINPNQIKNI